jgi:hypothetical protein
MALQVVIHCSFLLVGKTGNQPEMEYLAMKYGKMVLDLHRKRWSGH